MLQRSLSPAPLWARAHGSDAVTGCRRAVLWVRVAEGIRVAVYPVVGLWAQVGLRGRPTTCSYDRGPLDAGMRPRAETSPSRGAHRWSSALRRCCRPWLSSWQIRQAGWVKASRRQSGQLQKNHRGSRGSRPGFYSQAALPIHGGAHPLASAPASAPSRVPRTPLPALHSPSSVCPNQVPSFSSLYVHA